MPGRRSLAKLGAIAVAVALGVILAASVTTTAHAAPNDDILVSTDGVNFAPTLAGSVLVNVGELVPGESITASLWMRNPTAMPAVVRVSVGGVSVPSVEYGNGVTMSLWNSGTATSSSRAMALLNDCEVLVPSQPIAPNGTMRMNLTFTMGDLTGQSAQGQTATLALAIAMRDAEGGAFSSSLCGTGAERSQIAYTGSEPSLPLIALGAALVVGGIFLVVIRRRRRDASAETSRAGQDDAGQTS